jgi:hypothetical protein
MTYLFLTAIPFTGWEIFAVKMAISLFLSLTGGGDLL